MAEYRIIYSEDFFIQAYQRYQEIYGTRYIDVVIRSIGPLLSLAAGIYAAAYVNWLLATILFVMGLLLLGLKPFIYWSFRRNVRKSPHLNKEVIITLSPEEFRTVSSMADMRLSWKLFTKARRYSDGVLLFQGPLMYWFPDQGLTNGTAEEVASITQGNVKDYQVVEQLFAPRG